MKTFSEFQESVASIALKGGVKFLPKIVKVAPKLKTFTKFSTAIPVGLGIAGALKSKKENEDDIVNRPIEPKKPTPKDGESWTSGIGGRPTRNLSGRWKTFKRKKEKHNKDLKDFNDKLTVDSPYKDFKPDKTIPGDNPQSRAQTRDMLNKKTGDQTKEVKKINYNDYSDAMKKWKKGGKKENKPKLEDFLEQAMAAPTNNVGDGQIAGTVEAGDDPPVKKKKRKGKKKTYAYGGVGSRRNWMV